MLGPKYRALVLNVLFLILFIRTETDNGAVHGSYSRGNNSRSGSVLLGVTNEAHKQGK